MAMNPRDKHQTGKNHHLIQAMRYAIDGIIQALREECSMRYHLLAAYSAIIMSVLLQISVTERLRILLTIFVVFIPEFLNTVTEAVTDLIAGHHYKLNVKKARNVAAGGALASAIFSVLVGLTTLVPRILAIIR